MTDIHIPPAALEAGARAAHDFAYKIDNPADPNQWGEMPEAYKEMMCEEARAAFVAMVGAWPMVNTDAVRCGTLILHLPKETHDDKA